MLIFHTIFETVTSEIGNVQALTRNQSLDIKPIAFLYISTYNQTTQFNETIIVAIQ